MSDPNIKQLTVTGNAAESYLNKGSRKRRRSSANKTVKQDGGAPTVTKQQGGTMAAAGQRGGTSPGTIVQIQANKAPDAPALGPDAVSQAKASTANALAKTTTNSAPAPVTTTAVATKDAVGGGKDRKPVKVILGEKKKGAKVILSPTKIKKLPGASPTPVKTRKVAKKIRVSLHGLNKRVTRANHIRKEATKQPIAEVKKTLVSAKLIKPDSKAPEDILRKMYADYMMLKNRAL
jgi:hypothetical protein